MFTRKLTVVVVPLVLCALVSLLIRLVTGTGFWYYVLSGAVIGLALALLLPLSGASKRREPFGGMLAIPLLVLSLLLVFQCLYFSGAATGEFFRLFAAVQPTDMMVEASLIAFMLVTLLRTGYTNQ